MLYGIYHRLYSLMLTVSQSCEDSVTDNYSVRGSGWVLHPKSLRYGIVEKGAESSHPQGVLHTVRGVYRTGFDPVGTMLAFHPCFECQKLQLLHYCTK